MTEQQRTESRKCLEHLQECRKHLDNASFRMGDIEDNDYLRIRNAYTKICEAIDLIDTF